MLTFGPRSSVGFFMQPMSQQFGWGRDVFALAFAVQNLLWGIGQPFAGASTSQEEAIVAALGRRSVVLVGMMGAGKSTVGRRLAGRLRLPFVDADVEIEAAAGMSIPDIFETHGEPHFRDGEARVIARLLDGGPQILATGGGAFMREDTRARIRDKAISLWLKADADVILRRVKRRAGRPLLQTADPAATIGRLIELPSQAVEPCDFIHLMNSKLP
eukprot:gene61520-84151_t